MATSEKIYLKSDVIAANFKRAITHTYLSTDYKFQQGFVDFLQGLVAVITQWEDSEEIYHRKLSSESSSFTQTRRA